jgi:predicted RND superfamily exporter protein
VHVPRPPAISQGTAALLWAVALGTFVLLLMLGIGVPLGTSLIVSIVSGVVIFFTILLLGQDRVRGRS